MENLLPDDVILARGNAELLESEVHGEVFALCVETGVCYGFNPSASAIWNILETPKKFSELVDCLVADYDVRRDSCARQTSALIAELNKDGLVSLEIPEQN